MRGIIVGLVLMALSGCAPQAWYNTDPSMQNNQQLSRDKARCTAMANSGGSSQIVPAYGWGAQNYNTATAMGTMFGRDQLFKDCMAGEGWSLRRVEQ